MNTRYSIPPDLAKSFDTAALRTHFLIDDLFADDGPNLTYSFDDRALVGGVSPAGPAELAVDREVTGTDYLLERRELGIINVGGAGTVELDGTAYQLGHLDCLYVGRGTRRVVFASQDSQNRAYFYLQSVPAHADYPTTQATISDAEIADIGCAESANQRRIHRYIHVDGIQSCQLVMGFTTVAPGSVWNTMPAHTHSRRMEAYFYFDVPEDQVVFHYMGEPTQTRHLVVRNHQAVLSPGWSIHAGSGTSSYSFIWGMAGENMVYSDMDAVDMRHIL